MINKNKKGAVIAPLPDFVAYLLFIIIILFFFLLLVITKGCTDQTTIPEPIDQTKLQAEYLLLNFLQNPVNQQVNIFGNNIEIENMADLIVLSSPQLDLFVEESAKEYFDQNYFKWWELTITYPNGNQEIIESLHKDSDDNLVPIDESKIHNLLYFGPITSLHLENSLNSNAPYYFKIINYNDYNFGIGEIGDDESLYVQHSNEDYLEITITESIPALNKEQITIQLKYWRIPAQSVFSYLEW